LQREQAELEIEFNRHGITPGIDRHHLHPRCFAAWEFERTKIEPPGPSEGRLAI
jgi:hypothetical protein